MIGSIAGDIIGQPWEGRALRSKHHPDDLELFQSRARFTDDTVLTVAVADWMVHGGELPKMYRKYFFNYSDRGFGGMFRGWCRKTLTEYTSYGNGGAMRVAPVGWMDTGDLDEVLAMAEKTAMPTHSHPEGIKGAKAIAGAVWLARKGKTKTEILQFARDIGYDVDNVDTEILADPQWFATAQATVPMAFKAFAEGDSFIEVMRESIRPEGDSDTIAAMAGGIAEAHYGVPDWIIREVALRLDPKLMASSETFIRKYMAEMYGDDFSWASYRVDEDVVRAKELQLELFELEGPHFDPISMAIDEERYDKARDLLSKATEVWGSDYPEILRYSTLLAFVVGDL